MEDFFFQVLHCYYIRTSSRYSFVIYFNSKTVSRFVLPDSSRPAVRFFIFFTTITGLRSVSVTCHVISHFQPVIQNALRNLMMTMLLQHQQIYSKRQNERERERVCRSQLKIKILLQSAPFGTKQSPNTPRNDIIEAATHHSSELTSGYVQLQMSSSRSQQLKPPLDECQLHKSHHQ